MRTDLTFRFQGPLITRVVSVASDVLVLIITWRKTAETWRISRHLPHSTTQLTTLLLRDGTHMFSHIGRELTHLS